MKGAVPSLFVDTIGADGGPAEGVERGNAVLASVQNVKCLLHDALAHCVAVAAHGSNLNQALEIHGRILVPGEESGVSELVEVQGQKRGLTLDLVGEQVDDNPLGRALVGVGFAEVVLSLLRSLASGSQK